MDEYRINRIMEIALSLNRKLKYMKCINLAREASDIYATAKEEIEARSMLKEEAVKTWNTRPIEDEKDKVIAKLKGNWDYLKEYLVALRNSRLHEECLAGSVLNRFAISFLNGLIEKMNAADNNVGSIEKFERD